MSEPTPTHDPNPHTPAEHRDDRRATGQGHHGATDAEDRNGRQHAADDRHHSAPDDPGPASSRRSAAAEPDPAAPTEEPQPRYAAPDFRDHYEQLRAQAAEQLIDPRDLSPTRFALTRVSQR